MDIREMRKQLGCTQSEFASRYNIPFRTVQNWETGLRKPPEYIVNLLNNQVLKDNTISIIKKFGEKVQLNNQPFDLENLEAFYYHLCDLFIRKIEEQKKKEYNKYLNCLRRYIFSISNELKEYNNENYTEEKKDNKKFLTIVFSIINLDVENSHRISQVTEVFQKLDDEERKQMISMEERKIKSRYNKEVIDEFKKKN